MPMESTLPLAPSKLNLEYQLQPMTHFRWVILGLVFFGTTVNYMDRQILAYLAPDLRDKYHFFTDTEYGAMQAIFALAYALGQLFSGRWIDWIGTRLGYALSLFSWSIMSILHVAARSAMSFSIVRALLGISESPNFPAAVKTLAEWFPRSERAFCMGMVNTGVLLGTIIVPLVVPVLTLHFGWQSAFIVTGLCGMIWLALWLPLYRLPEEHPRVSPAELAHINSDPPEPAIHLRWVALFATPQAWAFMIGKLLTDPLWWFYMTWFPNYFRTRHLDLTQMGLPLVIIYSMASVGSIAGGWLSCSLLRRGWSLNASRKTAMLVSALVVLPMIFTTHMSSLWAVVPVLGLAVAGHQGFSSNLYTLVSDMFPRAACGSVSGIGGSFGYAGSFVTSILTGLVVGRWTHQNYSVLFLVAGVGYLVAFLIIHLLVPQLAPANLQARAEVCGFEPMVPPTQ